eukprot:3360740-Alexandrium_andersonii.AAC.1
MTVAPTELRTTSAQQSPSTWWLMSSTCWPRDTANWEWASALEDRAQDGQWPGIADALPEDAGGTVDVKAEGEEDWVIPELEGEGAKLSA